MKRVNYEWRKGPDFAEFAEALKINTNQILAASPTDKHVIVLYTPDESGRPPVWEAALVRDVDGVLVVKGEPTVNRLSRTGDE